MDKVSQLFIRACKTEDSITRLKSVYRRFYGRYDKITEEVAIGDILIHLVDEVSPMKLSEYLREVSSYKSYDQISGDVTETHVITLFIARDRLRQLTKPQMLELGMNVPARWRKRQ